jgi:hypothetical protein
MLEKLLLTSLLISIFTSRLYAQEIDSLHSLIRQAKASTLKVDYMSSLSRVYRFSNPDSATFWAKQGLLLARKLNYEKGIAKCLNHLGVIHWIRGNYDSAII